MNQDGEEDPLQSDIELPKACEQDNDDDVVAGPVCDDHGSVSSRSTRGQGLPQTEVKMWKQQQQQQQQHQQP